MDNVEAITQILDNAKSEKETQDLLSQIEDFDAYIKNMQVEITKKRIMLYREDSYPQIVSFNY